MQNFEIDKNDDLAVYTKNGLKTKSLIKKYETPPIQRPHDIELKEFGYNEEDFYEEF